MSEQNWIDWVWISKLDYIIILEGLVYNKFPPAETDSLRTIFKLMTLLFLTKK